ncbi:MAG: hypothetical protein AB7G15_10895 [Alphaproteobacteria bacterium]
MQRFFRRLFLALAIVAASAGGAQACDWKAAREQANSVVGRDGDEWTAFLKCRDRNHVQFLDNYGIVNCVIQSLEGSKPAQDNLRACHARDFFQLSRLVGDLCALAKRGWAC